MSYSQKWIPQLSVAFAGVLLPEAFVDLRLPLFPYLVLSQFINSPLSPLVFLASMGLSLFAAILSWSFGFLQSKMPWPNSSQLKHLKLNEVCEVPLASVTILKVHKVWQDVFASLAINWILFGVDLESSYNNTFCGKELLTTMRYVYFCVTPPPATILVGIQKWVQWWTH